MVKREGISKETITRNYVQGFILASLWTTGIILAFSNKIHLGYILLGIGYWALWCGVVGIATYYYHKSHPQLSKAMNDPKVQKGFSSMNIYFGILLVIFGIYQLISRNTVEMTKVSLVTVGFGLLTILWGYLDKRREKRKKTE